VELAPPSTDDSAVADLEAWLAAIIADRTDRAGRAAAMPE
jgi:hypothetical protein